MFGSFSFAGDSLLADESTPPAISSHQCPPRLAAPDSNVLVPVVPLRAGELVLVEVVVLVVVTVFEFFDIGFLFTWDLTKLLSNVGVSNVSHVNVAALVLYVEPRLASICEHHTSSCRIPLPLQNWMIFWKSSRGGSHFQSKNLCCRFWELQIGLFEPEKLTPPPPPEFAWCRLVSNPFEKTLETQTGLPCLKQV